LEEVIKKLEEVPDIIKNISGEAALTLPLPASLLFDKPKFKISLKYAPW
jgi:hypothetical protein